ncbi:MAG: ATP-binding cassette domain-containing protein [Tissierellia bacterium]|nr:ATP-binding cassette domain-containing protein [Tissierellia bacterium]
MTDEKVFLKAQDIKKSFGSIEVLRGVDFSVRLGEVVALVGDNGAGKSTLIKVLSGALVPDHGEIWIDSHKVQQYTPRYAIQSGVTTVYQDLSLVDTADVAYNIFLGQELLKGFFMDKKAMKTQAEGLLKSLDIDIYDVEQEVGLLSGGQRQAIAIARAVYNKSKLIIMDEPTAAMGIRESGKVLKLIKKLAREGYGILIISHNLQSVFDVADRICVMLGGRIIEDQQKVELSPMDVTALITGILPGTGRGENGSSEED